MNNDLSDLVISCTKGEFTDMVINAFKSANSELHPPKQAEHQGGAEYATRKEVSQTFKISLPTLNRLSKDGTLTAYRIGGRVLYRKDEMNNALTAIPNLKYRRAQ